VFYNGFERPIEVAIYENNEIMILDNSMFNKLNNMAK